jgi:hypothetical protein
MVAPPAWRVAVGLVGGGATIGLAYATLALAWHYPSDVLAGYLLAGLGAFVAIAILQRIEVADPEPARPPGLAVYQPREPDRRRALHGDRRGACDRRGADDPHRRDGHRGVGALRARAT